MDAIAQQRRDSQDLFEQYATRGAKLLFMQIPEPTDVLPDVTKTRVLHLLTYLLKMPAQWETTCPLLLRLAPHMEKMGHRQDWLALLQAGSLVAERQHDDQAMVHLALHIGYLHQLGGEFQNAYGWFKKGVNYSSAMPQKPMLGRLLNYQAYVAKLQRRFEEATHLVEKAMRILPTSDPELAHSYFILGTIAQAKLMHDLAVQHFFSALHIRQQQGDQRRIARCYRGLGTAYFALADYVLAIEYTEKAVVLFSRMHDISEEAVAIMNIGAIYLQMGEVNKALLRFRDAEPILRKTADKVHLAMLYNNIGYGFQMQQNWTAARDA
ncbi:MAG: tetratricopeptide repeat protein, partial [Caldilineaceae bacterium]|nr:tetratricopeptide repeat protein [Caldilineaceae bacterium]